MDNFDEVFYPDMIRNLPEIDIALEGVRGWLIQNEKCQVVLFEIEPVGVMPDHSHCAQWGIMLDGEMKLTIDNQSKIYKRGDRYFIPEGVTHSAEFLTKVYIIDFFDDSERYEMKT